MYLELSPETPETAKRAIGAATGLNGFTSLRTRPILSTLSAPAARCERCGAILRRGNPGPICAPCRGTPSVPTWAVAIVELDSRPATINMIAGVLGHLSELSFPEAVHEDPASVGEAYGLSRSAVEGIVVQRG